jgi:hypothetical protein
MLRAQRPFTDLQRPLIEGLGLCVLAFGFVEPRQAVDYGAHIRMFRTEGFLKNLERPFIKGLGLRVFALGLIKLCQVEFLAFVHPGTRGRDCREGSSVSPGAESPGVLHFFR